MTLTALFGKYLLELVIMYTLMSVGDKSMGLNVPWYKRLLLAGTCALATLPIIVLF